MATTLGKALIEAVRAQIDTEEITPERSKALDGAVMSALAAAGYQGNIGLTYYTVVDGEIPRLAAALVHHLQVSPLSPDYDATLTAMTAACQEMQARTAEASTVARV